MAGKIPQTWETDGSIRRESRQEMLDLPFLPCHATPRFRCRAVSAVGVFLSVFLAAAGAATPAAAQGWTWPWEEENPVPRSRPTPPEPMRRVPEAPPPASPPPAAGGNYAGNWSSTRRGSICAELEQRLVQESQRGRQSRDQLPQIEAEVREASRASHDAEAQLDQLDCYDYFLFTKTLRRTRRCVDLSNQAAAAKSRLSALEARRQEILSSAGRSYQDDIIRELARNNCGGNYAQEARRRERDAHSSFWEDEESPDGGDGTRFGALPYATYRTLCVRLCDGYYFPVSFSTLPGRFEHDEEVCQSKCAAPAELYYHQNPGGAVDQAVSARTQEPYTKLKTAFRYRKEYVQGCSCKQAEYVPEPGNGGQAPADRRAEAAPGGAQGRNQAAR